MTETASQKAARLMQEVDGVSKSNYTKGEVKTILNNIAQTCGESVATPEAEGCRAPAEITSIRRGDVFIAKMVGGKVRPWIVLRVSDGIITAVAMSSGDKAPNMIRSQCRLWPGNWIGTTVSLFDASHARQEVTRPYTNAKHLREIEMHLVQSFGLLPRKHVRKASVTKLRSVS